MVLLAVWLGLAGGCTGIAGNLAIPPISPPVEGAKRMGGNTPRSSLATLSFRCQQPSNLAATNKCQPSHPVT